MIEYIIYGCLFMIGYKSAYIYLQPCNNQQKETELDEIIKQYSIIIEDKDKHLDVPV